MTAFSFILMGIFVTQHFLLTLCPVGMQCQSSVNLRRRKKISKSRPLKPPALKMRKKNCYLMSFLSTFCCLLFTSYILLYYFSFLNNSALLNVIFKLCWWPGANIWIKFMTQFLFTRCKVFSLRWRQGLSRSPCQNASKGSSKKYSQRPGMDS